MYIIDWVEPDENNNYNFLFDTCALIHLSKNLCVAEKMKEKLKDNYRYYICTVQNGEISGVPFKKLEKYFSSNWVRHQDHDTITDIAKILEIRRVSCVALPFHDFCVLDGSFREFIDYSSEPKSAMFYEIWNMNWKHIMDAIIGEAAIYNNCYLISTDGRLINTVNKHFDGRAMEYKDFILNSRLNYNYTLP